MKKMQCEACGSTKIKKISDDLFEGQFCGVQYSDEEAKGLLVEITGSVKIDHSDEVKNAIKRGEQYENAGDVTRAIEYYDKALDMDADNEEAQNRVQNAFEARKLEEYYIVEPTIDPEKNVENFLKQLATTENIACDIYKEISINSVTQKYNTFFFIKNKCKCDWSATICYRRYEDVTVYENRYDANLRRNVKTPVTKKVEKIDRVPRSGTYSYTSDGLIFGSDAISQGISQSCESLAAPLLESFEALQDDKYGSYSKKKIDARNVTKENEKFYYNGYELDLEVDENLYINKKQLILEKGDQAAVDNITSSVGGDFREGWSATRTVTSHSVSYICIPVQIIEYSYKGQNYVAVSDLVSCTTSMPLIFPGDKELVDAKSALKQDSTKTNRSPAAFTVGVTLMIVDFSIMLIVLLMAGVKDDFLDSLSAALTVIISVGTLLFASLIFMIIGNIQKQNLKNKFNDNFLKLRTKLYIPRMIALSDSYDAFFKKYSEVASVDTAAKSADVNSISVVGTYTKLSPAGELREFLPYSANELPEEDREMLQIEEEKAIIKKNRIVGIVLALVSCFIILPLFITGLIIFSNCNKKLQIVESKQKALQEKWFNNQ